MGTKPRSLTPPAGNGGRGFRPNGSNKPNNMTNTVASPARLMLATPSMSSPAVQIGRTSIAGPMLATPLTRAETVVTRVHAAMSKTIDRFGRPRRANRMTAEPATARTMIGVMAGCQNVFCVVPVGGGPPTNTRTNHPTSAAMTNGNRRIGKVWISICPRRWTSSGIGAAGSGIGTVRFFIIWFDYITALRACTTPGRMLLSSLKRVMPPSPQRVIGESH